MTRVEINGVAHSLDDPATVEDAVAASGAGSGERGVAVAIDGEVVPRSQWSQARLTEGMKIEVVQAIQGG